MVLYLTILKDEPLLRYPTLGTHYYMIITGLGVVPTLQETSSFGAAGARPQTTHEEADDD